MHDPTLGRTTTCRGRIDARSAQSLRACRLDLLGTAGITRPSPSPERVPTLEDVLNWARAAGARLTVEIKDAPARSVVATVARSGVSAEQVDIRSFRPRDLEIAHDAGWRTALLTAHGGNASAPDIASRESFDVLSPQWPLPQGFLDEAEQPVVPWTLNSAGKIEAALDAGVDGIVSDNPGLVRDLIDAG